jgi:hypothetical protein
MPNPACKFHSLEFQSAAQNKLGVPQSSCVRIQGYQINNNNPRHGPGVVDQWGHTIKSVNGIKGDGIRHMHDQHVDKLSKLLHSANILHKGGRYGITRTCTGLFNHHLLDPSQSSDEALRLRQGIEPDIVILCSQMPGTSFGNSDIMTDVKTLSPATAYECPHPENALDAKHRSVNTSYHRNARNLDLLAGTPHGTTGPVETTLNTYDQGRVQGLVFGAFGGVSDTVQVILKKVTKEAALDYCRNFDVTPGAARSIISSRMNQELGLSIHLAWAKLLLNRVRDFVIRPADFRAPAPDDLDEDTEAIRNHHHQFPDLQNLQGHGLHGESQDA